MGKTKKTLNRMLVRKLMDRKAKTTRTKMSPKQAKNWTAMNQAVVIEKQSASRNQESGVKKRLRGLTRHDPVSESNHLGRPEPEAACIRLLVVVLPVSVAVEADLPESDVLELISSRRVGL